MAETARAATDLRERVPLPTHKKNFHPPSTELHLQQHVKQKQEHEEEKEEEQQLDLSFTQHMIAGSAAGITEHVAMFPVDTLKTRVQMVTVKARTSTALLSLVKHEGAFGLYRGVGAMVLGAGPSHAVYFAVYEDCKRRFEKGGEGVYHPLAHMSAGACATIASDAVSTPMDVVKQRLQLKNSPYSGVGDCVRRIAREEGVRAFYASYRTTLVMNIPFTGVHFATYEAVKKALGEISSYGSSEEQLATHLVAGGSAGALASAVTTPLDVIKTRLQCQGVCGAERFRTSSVMEVARKIVSHEGVGALFKGLLPRVLFHTPAAAISWSTYEAGKAFLQKWNLHY